MLINLLYCPGHAAPRLTKSFIVPNVNSGEIETPLRAVLRETWGVALGSPPLFYRHRVAEETRPVVLGLSERKVQASALLSCLLGRGVLGGGWGGGESRRVFVPLAFRCSFSRSQGSDSVLGLPPHPGFLSRVDLLALVNCRQNHTVGIPSSRA